MAPYKHTILFLLMIVWLLERALSCENLSDPKNLSKQNQESHVHDEDFDLFTKLAVKNQSKTEVNETGHPGSERKSPVATRSEEINDDPDSNSTYNEMLANKNSVNETESTENEWDFSKILEYFLSFIYKLDTEEDSEPQKTSDEIKDDQPRAFNKNKFSTNKEECSTDSCDSIPRKEHYRSVGMNPDLDNDDKINAEKTQNPQENSEKLKQDEGGMSEKNKSVGESEPEDSIPDAAFDEDDKFERGESLEGKNDTIVTRKDNEDISVNNPVSQQESKEPIPEVEKTQNPQYVSEKSKKEVGGTPKKKLKSVSESEEYSQSVDSNPDVAFDEDDRFERRELLERKDEPKMTKKDEAISVNNPSLQKKGDDPVPKVDYSSDFVFSEERNDNGETRETQLNEKSLSGSAVKEHHDASESKFYSSKNPKNEDSGEGSDLTGENETQKVQKGQIKGNNFMPHESELANKENELKENSSDVDEKERLPDSKEISDSKSNSNSDLNRSEENEDSPEQSVVKPKLSPEMLSANSTETSGKNKTHSIETEPKFDYYDEDYINDNGDEYEDEGEYIDEYEDEGEYVDEYEEINDGEESYDFDILYFDDFQDENSDFYYYDETDHTFQDFFPPQTNDNVMGNPQVITDEPHEEKNYTYSNFHKPPEAFDTILEYLYKYSNNPLFNSLNRENSTEAENKTM